MLNIDYRLAPEHPFPAAQDDTIYAIEWVFSNADALSVDPTKIAVAGSSAGANLVTTAMLRLHSKIAEKVALQALINPAVDCSIDSESFKSYSQGFGLDSDQMEWFYRCYAGSNDRTDPLLSPLRASVQQLQKMPRTIVLTAELDPLRDHGEQYANRLRDVGVRADLIRVAGRQHGFLSAPGVAEESPYIISLLAALLSHALEPRLKAQINT